jgi:Inner membrane component of T3SS, cytoplasmic domain
MTDKMEVIGLLTFGGDRVNGQEISGFDFVVPSSTVMEFVKAAGVANELGPSDRAYQEGLQLYWDEHYSSAIPKFEEVKRLFPEHSEVNRLIQSSQQSIAEGKEKSSFPWFLLAIVLVILFFIVVIIVIGVTILFIARMRSKSKTASAGISAGGLAGSTSTKPGPSHGAATPRSEEPKPPSTPPPFSPSAGARGSAASDVAHQFDSASDGGQTVDLSRTLALTPPTDTAPISYGSIKFVSGVLLGQKFDVTPDGASIGRDSALAQIVLADPRISKSHVWIGVRDGRVTIADQGSRNGTFVNDPKSARVTETSLNDGDVVILGESDVARFEYHK